VSDTILAADPGAIRRLAGRLAAAGDGVRSAATAIGGLTDGLAGGDWLGVAADAFALAAARLVAHGLEAAAHHDDAARALCRYADDLEHGQGLARSALRAGDEADARVFSGLAHEIVTSAAAPAVAALTVVADAGRAVAAEPWDGFVGGALAPLPPLAPADVAELAVVLGRLENGLEIERVVPDARDRQAAIELTADQRQEIVESFFAAYPGRPIDPWYTRLANAVAPEDSAWETTGFGLGIWQFTDWQIDSGRLTTDRSDYRWWRAINGAIVLDLADAHRCLNRRIGSNDPAVAAWIDYAHLSRDPLTDEDAVQAAWWRAHHVSLHSAIDDAWDLFADLPPVERRFAAQVVENADVAARIGLRSGDGGLGVFVDAFYPDDLDATVERVERLEQETSSRVLLDCDGFLAQTPPLHDWVLPDGRCVEADLVAGLGLAAIGWDR
jgi:hypothetical protein